MQGGQLQTEAAVHLQDLMLHAPEVANVVDACSVEGRQERLDTLLAGLELCEKALQVRGMQFQECCRAWHQVAGLDI